MGVHLRCVPVIYGSHSVCTCLRLSLSPGCDGASDAGAGPGHVHPLRHRRLRNSDHLHAQPGRLPQRQEVQEGRLELSRQERGQCLMKRIANINIYQRYLLKTKKPIKLLKINILID